VTHDEHAANQRVNQIQEQPEFHLFLPDNRREGIDCAFSPQTSGMFQGASVGFH
jgi:hypothetical protein